LFAATGDELKRVEGIGDVKAKKIRELLDSEYCASE
jgi:ERCC4-type nuclease